MESANQLYILFVVVSQQTEKNHSLNLNSLFSNPPASSNFKEIGDSVVSGTEDICPQNN